ncbi:MAG TPA: universal stress protein [Mycobacteriales bacterium]|nr:universal stress protein [Mycobacteriales bacterium]
MDPERSDAPVVLVGFDESVAGRAALDKAADLVRRLGGVLKVVHAVAPATPLTTAPAGLPGNGFVVPPPEDVEAMCARTREVLDGQVRERLAGFTGSWTFDVVHGDAVTVLEEQADAVNAYAVVVGTRHAGIGTALDRLLTGSTSRGLQRRCSRPVLVVPEPHG